MLPRASATGLTCPNAARAFLSFGGEAVRDFLPADDPNLPTGVPIVSPDRTTSASDWASLFDDSIESSMCDANVTCQTFGTGTTGDGLTDTYTCNNWTTASGGVSGRYGSAAATNGAWLSAGLWTCNDTFVDALCLCY